MTFESGRGDGGSFVRQRCWKFDSIEMKNLSLNEKNTKNNLF
jgi:hypothetical protein